MLLVLIAAVFLLTFLVTITAFSWLLSGPARKQQIVTRLRAIQEAAGRSDAEAVSLLKHDLGETLPFHRRWIATFPGIPQVRLFLDQAAVGMEAEAFVGLSALIGFGLLTVLVLAGFPALYGMLMGIGAAVIPGIVVYLKRESRFRKFEELFPEAIDQLARAVRAGHAFTSGFELIGQELPDPVGQEFRTTYAQQNLGVPLPIALQNFAARVPLPDVRFFAAAVQIQRESGGNLGEVLDSLSQVVRERFKLLRQVRVFTAEGRLSMYVLLAVPFIAGFALYAMNPEYMTPLLTDPKGHVILTVAAIMQVVGFLIIRRMIRFKV
jgi:tight adherence protein B